MASNPLSRRTFFRSAVGIGAVMTVGGLSAATRRPATASLPQPEVPKAKYGLVIDTTKCTGCGACKAACQIRNDLPQGTSYVRIKTTGDESSPTFVAIQCQHCAQPPCAQVCPAKATYRRDDGVVMIHEKMCVGCKYCELACPYQARVYVEERGVADKCWLCLDYVQEGKNPACVDACVLGARTFGQQDDPTSEVAKLVASGQAQPLYPDFGTQPSIVHYIIEGETRWDK